MKKPIIVMLIMISTILLISTVVENSKPQPALKELRRSIKAPNTALDAIDLNQSFTKKEESEKQHLYNFRRNEDAKPLRARIEEIETELKNSNAIDRLNSNTISVKEREMVFEQFKTLDRLRAEELEFELQVIEREVDQLKSELPLKLQALGVRQ